MRQLLRIKSAYFFSLFLSVAVMLSSCNKDMSISLDSNDFDNIGVVFSDSTSIETATILLDDIPTSNAGRFAVGTKHNDLSGSVEANAYFRLSTSSLLRSIPENARFDSVSLVVFPNKYYYGDTTKNMNLEVHRVTEELKLETTSSNSNIIERPIFLTRASIFNKTKYAYEANALGNINFKPEINTLDSIHIKLNNAFGKELYESIVNKEHNLSSEENFNEYLKGLVITSNNTNQAIIGLKDSIQLRVHYSYTDNNGFDVDRYENFIQNSAYGYTNINADRTGTAFEPLTYNTPLLSTSSTNGKTYIEGGAGVVTQIKFPYLLDFVGSKDFAINKAELVIEVNGVQDKKAPLPNQLNIFIANHKNIPESILLAPFSSANQTVPLIPGSHSSNGKYVFNLTQYIKNLTTDNTLNNKSLFLTLPTADLLNSVNRLEILSKDSKPLIKLNIVYTKFKN